MAARPVAPRRRRNKGDPGDDAGELMAPTASHGPADGNAPAMAAPEEPTPTPRPRPRPRRRHRFADPAAEDGEQQSNSAMPTVPAPQPLRAPVATAVEPDPPVPSPRTVRREARPPPPPLRSTSAAQMTQPAKPPRPGGRGPPPTKVPPPATPDAAPPAQAEVTAPTGTAAAPPKKQPRPARPVPRSRSSEDHTPTPAAEMRPTRAATVSGARPAAKPRKTRKAPPPPMRRTPVQPSARPVSMYVGAAPPASDAPAVPAPEPVARPRRRTLARADPQPGATPEAPTQAPPDPTPPAAAEGSEGGSAPQDAEGDAPAPKPPLRPARERGKPPAKPPRSAKAPRRAAPPPPPTRSPTTTRRAKRATTSRPVTWSPARLQAAMDDDPTAALPLSEGRPRRLLEEMAGSQLAAGSPLQPAPEAEAEAPLERRMDSLDPVAIGLRALIDPPEVAPLVIHPTVPPVYRDIFEYLSTAAALREEGLFRVPGSKSAIDALTCEYALSGAADLSTILDPHTICGLLKNQLKKPGDNPGANLAFATSLHEAVEEKSTEQIRLLLTVLPEGQYHVFANLVVYLAKVVAQDGNRMTTSNLGNAMGLSIFPSLPVTRTNTVIAFLIRHVAEIWDEFLGQLRLVQPPLQPKPKPAPAPAPAKTKSRTTMFRF